MKIHTFATWSEDLAPGLRAIARIRNGSDWHPVIFHAATEEDARIAAQTWWDAEIAKVQAARDRAQARGDSRKRKGVEATVDTPAPEPVDDDPGPIL